MGDVSKPERRRLDSIGTLWFKGQPFKKTDIVETGKYPCLHYGELFSKYGAIIDSVSSRCDVFPKRLSQKGDILFPASDVTPAGLTRCSAIMQEDVILGGDVIGFRPQTGLNPIYLSYAIRHQKTQLLQRVTGALIKHISAKSLQSIIIPIHPIESQDRFEKQVRHLNRIISHRRAQLANLDELVKCRFVEMFGDCRSNPKQWATKKLEEIAIVGSSKRVFVEELIDDGIPFYRGTEVGALAEGQQITPELFISESHYQALCEASGKPVKGDLLMPSICPDGRIWIVDSDSPFYFKDGRVLWVHDIHEQYNPVFLQYTLKDRIIADYASIASGTTFAELKIFTLKSCKIFDVPLSLQNIFAAFIRRIDKLRIVIRQSLDEAQKLFESLIQEYFD